MNINKKEVLYKLFSDGDVKLSEYIKLSDDLFNEELVYGEVWCSIDENNNVKSWRNDKDYNKLQNEG